jgi:hypothetical protein
MKMMFAGAGMRLFMFTDELFQLVFFSSFFEMHN